MDKRERWRAEGVVSTRMMLAVGEGKPPDVPPPGERLMAVMTLCVSQMEVDLAPRAQQALERAYSRWIRRDEPPPLLTQSRVECWEQLQFKNGNSVTIDDATDVAIRALICVLWDTAPDPEVEEGGDVVEVFSDMVVRYGELRSAVEIPTEWTEQSG